MDSGPALPPSPSFLPQLVCASMGVYRIIMVTVIAVCSSISFPLFSFIDTSSETVLTKIKYLEMGILSQQFNSFLCLPSCNTEIKQWDFPGGTVVGNPPASAGDKGSDPGPGGSHMPRSNSARAPQLLSLYSRAREPQLLKPT